MNKGLFIIVQYMLIAFAWVYLDGNYHILASIYMWVFTILSMIVVISIIILMYFNYSFEYIVRNSDDLNNKNSLGTINTAISFVGGIGITYLAFVNGFIVTSVLYGFFFIFLHSIVSHFKKIKKNDG